MSESQVSSLGGAHRAMQEKLIYFLMAAAGACIGFALTQAKDLTVDREHIALALALILWASSFWFGFKRVQFALGVIWNNVELIRAQTGRHPLSGSDPELAGEVVRLFREQIEGMSTKANRCADFQAGCLILGVLAYVTWQVLLMLQRSV